MIKTRELTHNSEHKFERTTALVTFLDIFGCIEPTDQDNVEVIVNIMEPGETEFSRNVEDTVNIANKKADHKIKVAGRNQTIDEVRTQVLVKYDSAS